MERKQVVSDSILSLEKTLCFLSFRQWMWGFRNLLMGNTSFQFVLLGVP